MAMSRRVYSYSCIALLLRTATGESGEVLSNALKATRDRAEALRRFFDATRGTGYLGDEGALGDGKTFEIYNCLPTGTAFVHVFKAAGTTGVWFLNRVCPQKPIRYVSWGEYCNPNKDERDDYRCRPRSLDVDVIFQGVNRTFTFVRDPVDRFQSGVFELVQRGDHGLGEWINRARAYNTSLADVTIDELIKMRRRRKIPDGHLMPQTYFLANFARPLPCLQYVAMVGPTFEHELAAIAQELGYLGLSRELVERGKETIPRRRDAHDPSYNHGFAYIRDELLAPITRAKIFRYYHEDYAWMGNMQYRSSKAAAHRQKFA